MTRKTYAVMISFVVLASVAGYRAFASAAKGVDAVAAFDRLRSLDGTWKVEAHEGGHAAPDKRMTVVYKVSAAGSVVMETLFPGTDREMVSMYHVDGDDLRLTHYCAAKNRPHPKLDKAASTPDLLVFAFDGGTGFDPAKGFHMHSGRIAIRDGKHIESEWDGYKGLEKMHSAKLVLSRP